MMQKLIVAILAFLPLPARANDGLWPDDALWEKVSEKPTMPYDPRTASPCTEWYNNDGSYGCDSVVSYTMTDVVLFHRWNPSIIHICKNFQKNKSYCLDASDAEPPAELPTPTTTLTPTPTHDPNGIFTPLPAQPGMVNNCNKFYAVGYDDTCASVSSLFVVSLDNFIKWNGVASKDCDQLTVKNYVCVSTFDQGQRTILASATSSATTSAGNGIQTPEPTQADMVSNCNKFHYIWKGNTCGQVTSYQGITQEQFARWNPKIGIDCTSLWSDHYACVGVDGESSTPSSTAPSNGIETPQPAQPEMVSNCNQFHYIWKGNSCWQITSYRGITQEQFAQWNPRVGLQCDGLSAEAYACVGVLEDAPTPDPTTPSNGIETPQPTQPDMVSNCNQFHYIWKGNTCWQITSHRGITQEQFAKWNPKIGLQCDGLWAETYACVGVLEDAPTPDPTPDPTTPSNGIETPQPTQPDMVSNCDQFHWISKGNTCGQITSYNQISLQDLATWNPQIGEQCTGLWADAYACVGVIGDAPTPDKTAPSNGIETPQPTQPGMVSNCKLFHWISKGNTCGQITWYNQISQQDLATWNPQIGEQCTGLWADAYACVGV
ncbi:hypothetical protein NHJ13734_005780 [Beauveria thailandica]